jgi:hypothetical protein
MNRFIRLLAGLVLGLLFASCGSQTPPAYFLSHPPDVKTGRQPRHYPVARQGDLTAWLTSDHARSVVDWLYAPGDPTPKYPIVGVIRAASMPTTTPHDGAFLIVSGYDGPLFELWEGTSAKGRLFTGSGWVRVELDQQEAVNTWVRVPGVKIGGWSGYPVVIGDPAYPDAIAGAMWYKSKEHPSLGGATSTRMLKSWLNQLRFSDFVKRP